MIDGFLVTPLADSEESYFAADDAVGAIKCEGRLIGRVGDFGRGFTNPEWGIDSLLGAGEAFLTGCAGFAGSAGFEGSASFEGTFEVEALKEDLLVFVLVG